MSLAKFAQNVEYLIKIGVPVEVAPSLLVFLNDNSDDKKWMLSKIKDNKGLSLDAYKQIYKETKERNVIDPVIVEWANKISVGHAKWLIQLAMKKSVRMGEDDNKLRAVLKTFEIVKERKLIPVEKRDILKYKTEIELYEVVKPFLMMGHTDEILIPEGTEGLLYDGEGIQVFQTNNANVTARFAKGTNWCVKDEGVAQSYLKNGPVHFVFVDTRKSVLIHVPSGQIKETNDSPLKNYSIIRRISPVLAQLGIDQPEADGRTSHHNDFNGYHDVLGKGIKINAAIAKKIGKGSPVVNVITQAYPEVDDQKDCLLYLEEQYISDPSIQQLCSTIFIPLLKDDLKENYKVLPRQIQLIPAIFETCKQEFIKEIRNSPGDYNECSNDLKKLPEIQKARFDGYVAIVIKDPEMNEDNIPEEYRMRPEMVRARYAGWLKYVRTHPEKGIPAEFQDDPAMLKAQAEGWYEKLAEEPYSYSKAPEEVKKSDRAQGIVWDTCLQLVAQDPQNFNSVPIEFRDDPYIYEETIKGWVSKIHANPLYFHQCPPDFQHLDVIKNAFSKEGDIIENPTASAEEVHNSVIRNWIDRIKFRLEEFKNVPKDLQNNPDIFNAALEGWVQRISANPHQINYCPPAFKKHPKVREELYKRNPAMRQRTKAGASSWYRLAIMDDPEIAFIDPDNISS